MVMTKRDEPDAGDAPKAKAKRQPTLKQRRAQEGIRQGKNRHRAHLDAGYAPSTAKSLPYDPRLNGRIVESVGRRRAKAVERAHTNTDVLVGYLYEIAEASLGDVLDEGGEFSVGAARENGVDHLIKKMKVTVRHTKDGARVETRECEMYSRLDAIGRLCDVFGMRGEPRPNTHDEDRRREVEASLDRIAKENGVDRAAAAREVLAHLGDEAPELASIVSEYTN